MTAYMNPSPTNPGGFDVACPEHADAERHGLRWNHARNAMEQHNREHHDTRPQEFHVGRVAALVIAADEDYHLARQDADLDKAWAATFAQRRLEEVLAMWMTLCAIPLSERDTAMARAREAAREDVVAHVTPF